MNREQLENIQSGSGFIAALDQSGGSTPKALEQYGIMHDKYSSDDEMFDLMHEMRTRIITCHCFNGDRLIGTILFEDTMDRDIDGRGSAQYLWAVKRIVPFLKVDKGLAVEADGVQLMNPIPNLDPLLARALEHDVFGTKMRSVIKHADKDGVKAVTAQQFEISQQIISAGLVPIIELEIDIHSPTKSEAEAMLNEAMLEQLGRLRQNEHVMLKLTLPEIDDAYASLIEHPNVLRLVALSGGYSREEASTRLARNHGVIASFSRALTEGLSIRQSEEQFDAVLDESIGTIFAASKT